MNSLSPTCGRYKTLNPFPFSLLDYTKPSPDLPIEPTHEQTCYYIRIIDDTIVEEDEQFQITLSSKTPSVKIGTALAVATIRDNDGKVV